MSAPPSVTFSFSMTPCHYRRVLTSGSVVGVSHAGSVGRGKSATFNHTHRSDENDHPRQMNVSLPLFLLLSAPGTYPRLLDNANQ